ncbi:hypothetical protein [Brunnivagina elsteri]|uniref:Uncharacterized protein n=1 Tax=Brunnivagina elsteri CCALA 953 TaxID=987040 RepID=A0A2A2TJ05_9CYAN|nr:hypothetical protein [Calothrix elsteri]PAX53977.1 hypothetical protein CK510_13000 [Calothrix elsteri CCALA 953]
MQAPGKIMDKISSSIGYLKGSLGQALQAVEEIKQSTSTAIQTSVNSPLNDLLYQHPGIFQVLKFVAWVANHPIRGIFIILLGIAVIWSVIRAVVRLIEVASLSILKTPLTFAWLFLKYIWQFSSKLTMMNWNKFKNANTTEIIHLEDINFQLRENYKQKRLGEISVRLIEIQKEQHTLLEEASGLMK